VDPSPSGSGEEVPVYTELASGVPCRVYNEKGKELFQVSQAVPTKMKAMFEFGQQLIETDRVLGVRKTRGSDLGFVGTLVDGSDTSMVTNVDMSSVVNEGETLLIEEEQVRVTDISGTTATVGRGRNGTSKVAHTGAALHRMLVPCADVEHQAPDVSGQGHHAEVELKSIRTF
jgi:hypothetical protein